jgi:CheY-like chemotaxis protein
VAELSILIVEDEWLIAALIEEALLDAGYQVQLATNGDKAAEQLSNSPDEFDILLTDIRMPGSTSGWDLARRARELNADLPIDNMTGDSFAAWKREGVSGSLMFQKPVSTQSLINAVAELLD